jgi:hypothetical protein
VVELVGLEPTTKVLWNMVGVRPTPLVGHPWQIAGRFAVLLDFPGFLILCRRNVQMALVLQS